MATTGHRSATAHHSSRRTSSCSAFATSIPRPSASVSKRSAITVVPWRDGKPESDICAALDKLADRVDDIYLHIDFDGFSPDVAPGIVDEPVPGGLSEEQAEAVIHGAGDRFRLRAATLAT